MMNQSHEEQEQLEQLEQQKEQHEQAKILIEAPVNRLEELVRSGININALDSNSFSALAVAINRYFSNKKILDSVGTYMISDHEIREAKLELNNSELRIKELLRLRADAGIQDCGAIYSPIYQALVRFDSEDGLDDTLQSLIKHALEYDQNMYGSIKLYCRSLKTYRDCSILEAYINNVCKKYWNNEHDNLLQQMITKYCKTFEGCSEVVRIFDLMIKENQVPIVIAIIKGYSRPIEGSDTTILGRSAQESGILKPFLKSLPVQEALEDYRGLKTVQELESIAEVDNLKLDRFNSILNRNEDISQNRSILNDLPDELKLQIANFLNLSDGYYLSSTVFENNSNNHEPDTENLGEDNQSSCTIL